MDRGPVGLFLYLKNDALGRSEFGAEARILPLGVVSSLQDRNEEAT